MKSCARCGRESRVLFTVMGFDVCRDCSDKVRIELGGAEHELLG